jgi:peptidoglycan hydrolase-like protein with peptidoglycan-binding domain
VDEKIIGRKNKTKNMSKMTKKIVSVGLAVSTTVWLMGASFAPVASAQAVTIETLLAQIQLLTAQLNAMKGAATAGTSSYTFTRNLTVGSKGADVSALQQVLINGGYLTVVSAPTAFFGPATKAALIKWQAAAGVSPTSGYFGPKSQAALALVTPTPGPGPTPVPVPGTGLALSLASDNPVAQALPRGATGVQFLKFNVAGSGTLDSLVFRRVGIGATADFGSNGVYLYEGNTRLTSGRTLNSTTHEVTFVNLALAVSGVRTFTLVADTASAGTAGNYNAFNLISGAGSVTVSGSLTGSGMTIAGQVVGGIVIDDGAAPTNPKIGQLAAKVAEFTLQASSTEDVLVKRISLTEGGTITNSYLTNFALKSAGNTIATAASIGAKDLLTLTFTTPFLLEKGQQRTFELFADVSGNSRSADTIVFYVDSAADVFATGVTYGYPVLPQINNFDTTGEADTLTLAGGAVTITFNGPATGDISRRGQDVTILDFTIVSQNNIEIKNLRVHTTSTFNTEVYTGFKDLKVWDATGNAVITSAVDLTASSTDTVFTDTINLSAGQTKRFKITVDPTSDTTAGATIRATLTAFSAGDVRNLDNNTNVTLTDIVPNSAIAGNALTVAAPTLTIGLAASPSSQTYVQGVSDKALAGFTFQATGGSVRIDTVRITGASSTGPLTSDEITSLALWDDTTKVSDVKSLDSSAINVSFTGLNLTIPQGSTKVLTLRGNVSTNATNGDVFSFNIATAGSADVTAYDKDGNTATYAGVAANSGATVTITITNVGNVSVATAPSDADTQADIILANGTEQTLAKFVFSATNEDMTVEKLAIKVSSSSDATGTSTTSGDEVPWVKLYDGSLVVGGPYYLAVSGASSSIVQIDGLNWVIPKDTNKVLTVKGAVNTISAGADTGASVYASIMASGFKANGVSSQDYGISAALGNQKIVYKSKPTFSAVSPQPNTGNGALTSGSAIKALRFRVAADANGAIAWRTIQFQVAMTNATMSAAGGGNIVLRNVATGSSLTLATVFSSTVVTNGSTATITNGSTGYVGMQLTTPEQIAAGSYQDYDLELTFTAGFSGSNANDSQAVVKLYRQETTATGGTTFALLAGTSTVADTMAIMGTSTIWSDQSVVGSFNATTTADWAVGVFLRPSLFTDVSNIIRD